MTSFWYIAQLIAGSIASLLQLANCIVAIRQEVKTNVIFKGMTIMKGILLSQIVLFISFTAYTVATVIAYSTFPNNYTDIYSTVNIQIDQLYWYRIVQTIGNSGLNAGMNGIVVMTLLRMRQFDVIISMPRWAVISLLTGMELLFAVAEVLTFWKAFGGNTSSSISAWREAQNSFLYTALFAVWNFTAIVMEITLGLIMIRVLIKRKKAQQAGDMGTATTVITATSVAVREGGAQAEAKNQVKATHIESIKDNSSQAGSTQSSDPIKLEPTAKLIQTNTSVRSKPPPILPWTLSLAIYGDAALAFLSIAIFLTQPFLGQYITTEHQYFITRASNIVVGLHCAANYAYLSSIKQLLQRGTVTKSDRSKNASERTR